jgi:anti-sigma factor RsiW
MTATADATTDEDEIVATLSDYLDGALPKDKQAEVEAKLASDADWKRVHAELRETRDAMSGLHKVRAPFTADDVTGTIHKRSMGRFFARRTLGDRVPFGVLLILALAALIAIAVAMRCSSTGSLKVDHGATDHGSESLAPP